MQFAQSLLLLTVRRGEFCQTTVPKIKNELKYLAIFWWKYAICIFKWVGWRHYSVYTQWSVFLSLNTKNIHSGESFSGKPSLMTQRTFTGITLSAPDDKICQQQLRCQPATSVTAVFKKRNLTWVFGKYWVYTWTAEKWELCCREEFLWMWSFSCSYSTNRSHTPDATQSTHHQLFDQSFSLSDHLSELCYKMQVFWSAFTIS